MVAPAPSQPKNLYGFVYRFLLADYLLRWLALAAWQLYYIGGFLFWLLQLCVIPSVMLFMVDNYSLKHKINSKEDQSNYTTSAAFVTSFIIFSATYIVFILFVNYDIFWRVIISIATFIVYGFYVVVINEGSLKKPLPHMETEAGMNSPGSSAALGRSDEQPMPVTDSNDIDLVRLEGMLHYTNDRVNSYILESALFSGLAFAGFVTLISSEKLHLTDISALFGSLMDLLSFLVVFDFAAFKVQFGKFSQDDLFILILIESLFCTLAFISVIASRLRFSDILEEIEISVKTARSFNDKEEEVVLLNLEKNKKLYQTRIDILNGNIEKEIAIANKKLDSIKPTLNSIRIIRSFGMLCFFSMIFTSALLINPVLAAIIVLISVFVAILMNIDHMRRIKRIRKLNHHFHFPHIIPKK